MWVRVWADRLTVKQQLALAVGLLCIALTAGVTAGAALFARSEAIKEANSKLAVMAQTVADQLDQDMFERYREVRNLASFAPLESTWRGDPAGIRGVLDQMQSTFPNFAWLGFAAPDGKVVAATRGMLESVSVAARPWFANGLKGSTVEDVHDAKLLDSLLRRSADEAPFRFVDVAMPVLGAGGVLEGVLGTHLSWNWASEVRDDVLRKQSGEIGTEIWILDRNGGVLLGPSGATPLTSGIVADTKARGSLVFLDERTERPLVTALAATKGKGEYPGLGWIVSAHRPADIALWPANRLALIICILGLATAFAGAGLAWLLAERLTRPLGHLCDAIDRIGRQDGTSIVERQHGSRDILQLSVALRSLLRRLGTAERDARETRVEADEIKRVADERTRRLGSDIHTLRVLADTDPLTGLFNRRAFLPFAEDAMNYYKRYRRGVAILMFDIDHFKRVNDTFGHSIGDDVIRAVGKVIAAEIRTTDKVARFGGEEYVVLLRETDEEGATLLANRIRDTVAGTVMGGTQSPFAITTSIGIALAREGDRDIEDVIARADKALYAAKSAGRNRAVLAESDVPAALAA